MHKALAFLAVALLPLLGAPADTPKLLRPFNVPVNGDGDEDEPPVAGDGRTLYFTAPTGGKDEVRYARRRSAVQPWPARSEVLEDYVKARGELRSVFATAGRYPHYLYFAARDEGGKNFDLFVAVRQEAGKAWSAPTPVMNVNTEGDELHPWLSADGRSLYFSRKTKDGWRVLVSKRDRSAGPQGWAEPEVVDLPADFHHATLTPDGKTMYLQGPLEKGRWGLFVARRQASGWGKPEPLTGLNHPGGKTGDRSPGLTRDGRLLYFASDRPGGKGGLDLWGIATMELAKRKG
jgi:hypothetical protein